MISGQAIANFTYLLTPKYSYSNQSHRTFKQGILYIPSFFQVHVPQSVVLRILALEYPYL